MDTIQIIVLSLVQGITEFLPISSSAHLILFPAIFGWEDQGIAFDVAVHLGTLFAVLLYFREDIAAMLVDWVGSLRGGELTHNAKMAWGIILGTIPAGLVGLAGKDLIEVYLRSPVVIAVTTILFGLLLWFADRSSRLVKEEDSLTWREFVLIGCAQALALVPGTSRSGITITAALMLGYTREAAARVSFLLSIPIIVLSSLLVTKDLVTSEEAVVNWMELGLGTLLSGVSAFLIIHYFLLWLQKASMQIFVVYRLILGVFLFWMFT